MKTSSTLLLLGLLALQHSDTLLAQPFDTSITQIYSDAQSIPAGHGAQANTEDDEIEGNVPGEGSVPGDGSEPGEESEADETDAFSPATVLRFTEILDNIPETTLDQKKKFLNS